VEQLSNDHLAGILLAIEVMWVAGFLAVFVIYFAIKWHIKKKRQIEAANESLADEEGNQRQKTDETKGN